MVCRNPECMAEVNPTALFCGKCGTPVIANCSFCGRSIPAKRNVKWCPYCGRMISEMHTSTTNPTGTSSVPVTPTPTDVRRPVTTTDGRSHIDSVLDLKSVPTYVGGGETISGVAPIDQIKTNRSLGMFILLTLVTFGIYSIYFYSKVGTDLNKIASRYDGKKTMHFCLIFFLLTPITFGIAALVWSHKMSDRVGSELRRRGFEKTIGSDTFWLWSFLGALIIVGPFIYVYKLCGAMNTLAEDYNARG